MSWLFYISVCLPITPCSRDSSTMAFSSGCEENGKGHLRGECSHLLHPDQEPGGPAVGTSRRDGLYAPTRELWSLPLSLWTHTLENCHSREAAAGFQAVLPMPLCLQEPGRKLSCPGPSCVLSFFQDHLDSQHFRSLFCTSNIVLIQIWSCG